MIYNLIKEITINHTELLKIKYVVRVYVTYYTLMQFKMQVK